MRRWLPCVFAAIGTIACGRVGFESDRDGGPTDADTRPRIVDVATGASHTCALASTGAVKCWGANDWGILGIGDATTIHPDPATLPATDLGAVAATDLVTRADYTCALLATRALKCWGNNDGAQLGLGDFDHRGDEPGEMGDALPTVALSAGPPIDQVVTGHYHTCVRRGGAVECWGVDDVAQNGYAGPRTTLAQLASLSEVDLGTDFVAVDIEAMFNSTCALDTLGRVKCWGANFGGNLGLGDTQTRGDSLSDMGDSLPFVDLGGPVQALAAGFGHACVLAGAKLRCWGDAADGALGSGDLESRGDQPGEMGASLPFVDLGGQVEQVACGGNMSCAILAGGHVKCWGVNQQGQLGVGDTENRGNEPGEMGTNLPEVPLSAPAIRVAVGGDHACAILATGELACWGSNFAGQLGTGDQQSRGDQVGETPVVHSVASLFGPPGV